ncbi:nucleoside diphosphate kinase [Candidatus Mancarchaeum acidiphilum]|uniref:nucleoside-diphosphate kinase n=1 Tax=Candidatus Mancarchaeum acidiphilum TaxID=1920749 RepID=A0A218NM62_9ARCH|nr:nucleoside-diphosphate kinase [Candidatus Mancarchaeum acidiphilum]ASI13555.1 nucleoside diphosphate kinase [Candidatus Mancarchaeum acidiphilum]
MIERTLVLIKPDGVQRQMVGKLLNIFEESGLKVVGLKLVKPKKENVEKHYAADEKWMVSVGTKTKASYAEKGVKLDKTELEIGQEVRNKLLSYLVGKPTVAIALEGNEAIYAVRKIIGSTEPKKADPGSIRGRFGTDSYAKADSEDRAVRNLVHASEDKENADREIYIWFDKDELLDYTVANEPYL